MQMFSLGNVVMTINIMPLANCFKNKVNDNEGFNLILQQYRILQGW